MLRSLDLLRDYWIHACDGQVGAVQDFFFDDRHWRIRYMVVDPGNWLPQRRVLISPVSIARANRAERQIEVDLSRQQIKESPAVDTHRPVARQMEDRIRHYFGWPAYWIGHPDPLVQALSRTAVADELDAPRDDPHLRSVKETTGYAIHASDGVLGELSDFLCDDEDWTIRYLVVSMPEIPGMQMLISPIWVQAIHWDGSKVRIALPCEKIRSSPKYDPTNLDRSYEARLHDYYGRQRYWV